MMYWLWCVWEGKEPYRCQHEHREEIARGWIRAMREAGYTAWAECVDDPNRRIEP